MLASCLLVVSGIPCTAGRHHIPFGRRQREQDHVQGVAQDIRLAADILEIQVRVLLATAVEMGKAGEYREVVRAHDKASTLEHSIDILNDLARIAESS